MNIKQIRLEHLLRHLARFDTDKAFCVAVNRELSKVDKDAVGFDPSYLSQLKNGDRNIGDKTARKLERGLGLQPNAFDRPLGDDETLRAEFEDLMLSTTPEQQLDAVRSIAGRVSPKTAVSLARILLESAEAGL